MGVSLVELAALGCNAVSTPRRTANKRRLVDHRRTSSCWWTKVVIAIGPLAAVGYRKLGDGSGCGDAADFVGGVF
jgi:hypothetical protein